MKKGIALIAALVVLSALCAPASVSAQLPSSTGNQSSAKADCSHGGKSQIYLAQDEVQSFIDTDVKKDGFETNVEFRQNADLSYSFFTSDGHDADFIINGNEVEYTRGIIYSPENQPVTTSFSACGVHAYAPLISRDSLVRTNNITYVNRLR